MYFMQPPPQSPAAAVQPSAAAAVQQPWQQCKICTIACAFNIDVSHQIEEWNKKNTMVGSSCQSQQEKEPLSEFEDLEELLIGGFSQVFMS